MSGDVHVRFYERPWGRFPRATHPIFAVSYFPGDDRFLYESDHGGNELSHL
jgi:hypothetical protein